MFIHLPENPRVVGSHFILEVVVVVVVVVVVAIRLFIFLHRDFQLAMTRSFLVMINRFMMTIHMVIMKKTHRLRLNELNVSTIKRFLNLLKLQPLVLQIPC